MVESARLDWCADTPVLVHVIQMMKITVSLSVENHARGNVKTVIHVICTVGNCVRAKLKWTK